MYVCVTHTVYIHIHAHLYNRYNYMYYIIIWTLFKVTKSKELNENKNGLNHWELDIISIFTWLHLDLVTLSEAYII